MQKTVKSQEFHGRVFSQTEEADILASAGGPTPETPSAFVPRAAVGDAFALLIEALGAISDVRHRRGRRHPSPGSLGSVVLGLMANGPSLSAISRYGQIHPALLAPLGRSRSPSVPTLSRVLAGIAPAAVRAAMLIFTRLLLTRREQVPHVTAIDGKRLRGVHAGDAPAHVLHLFAHETCLVWDQGRVPSVRAEVPAAEAWIAMMVAQVPSLAVLTAAARDADQYQCATSVAQAYAARLRLNKTRPPGSPTLSSSS